MPPEEVFLTDMLWRIRQEVMQRQVARLNIALQHQSLLLPRISQFPIVGVRWTPRGPMVAVCRPDGINVRLVTMREWHSLVEVTGLQLPGSMPSRPH